jgi:adenylate cyclase
MRRGAIRLAIGAVVFILFVCNTAGLLPVRLLTQIENLSYDFRIRATLPGGVDPRVVIVDIDEKSIAAIGQWPWRRDKLAQMLDQLFDRYHVKVVGFDVVSPDPTLQARLPQLREAVDTDAQFARATQGRPVIQGVAFQSYIGPGQAPEAGKLCAPAIAADEASQYRVDFLRPPGYAGVYPEHTSPGWRCGFFDNPTLDDDGVYRKVPLLQSYKGALYPSLPLAMVWAAQQQASPDQRVPVSLVFDPPSARDTTHLEAVRVGMRTIPVGNATTIYVPYRGPQFSFPYVSAVDVIDGHANAATLKDAYVLVGTTSAGLLDQRTTPVARNYAGVEVHANIISGIEVMILFLITLAMGLGFPRLSPLGSAGLSLGLAAMVFLLAWWLWTSANFIVPLGVPLTFIVAQFLILQLYGFLIESRKVRDISRLFGQYVPPEIVEEMAEHPETVSMETEDRNMTVLFSDIRGFTTISEQFKDRPQELSQLMNEFLGALTEVVFRHRGAIDKYMGDAIMAFWGAPLKSEDHGLRALQAAIEFPKALARLEERFKARGWPVLHIGVGLNTGNMRVGNMGSEFRVAYTVLGDTVNQASRFEGLTKTYGVEVICGESTRAGAKDWLFRELDRVRVKGKKEPVPIYEPFGPRESVDPDLARDLSRYRQALRAYRNQAFDEAEREFFGLSRSGRPHPLYELYLARIAHFRQHPPPVDWDGAFTFDHK